jgi:hypothetical protein
MILALQISAYNYTNLNIGHMLVPTHQINRYSKHLLSQLVTTLFNYLLDATEQSHTDNNLRQKRQRN